MVININYASQEAADHPPSESTASVSVDQKTDSGAGAGGAGVAEVKPEWV